MAAHGMLPYSQRPEWADVVPVRYDDGNKVVAIQYTPDHAEALSYFRAVMLKNELSERALRLTEDMIGYNQADYTAWNYRWRCLEALGPSFLPGELEFMHKIMLENAKNYQLWNHRRKCAMQLGEEHVDREVAFTREALSFDEKNYHAWAHRQAILKLSGKWEEELLYCEEMLERDVRNNSAWNQRMFVLQHIARGADGDDNAWLRKELEYVSGHIQRAPRNEAPWRYLTGLFSTLEPWRKQPRALSRWPEMYMICAEALRDCPSCAPALDVMAQYYEGVAALESARARNPELSAGDRVVAEDHAAKATDAALVLLDDASVADPMRVPYWHHRFLIGGNRGVVLPPGQE